MKDTKRAVRRYDLNRVKDSWRWRVRRFWAVKDESLVERLALRRATHPKHDCIMCKGPKMDARPVARWTWATNRNRSDDE